MKKHKIVLSFLLIVFSVQISIAQPREQAVKIIITPDHQNWACRVGEKVRFSVPILQDGNVVKNSSMAYSDKRAGFSIRLIKD